MTTPRASKSLFLSAIAVAAVALTLGACSPKYRVVSNEAESPVLSGDCSIRVLQAAPSEAFTVIGTVEPENPEKLTDSDDVVAESIKAGACTRTANAVIVAKDPSGKITKGTLIRIK